VRRLQQYQVGEIVQTACSWTIGEWHFSPLARIVEGVESEIESAKILLETARKFPLELIVKRFIGQKDTFSPNYNAPKNSVLNSTEGYLLSRLNNVADVAEIKMAAGIPELETYRALYSLWLGGFLHRHNWKKTFADEKIQEIIGAKLVKSGNLPPEAVAKALAEVKVEEVAPKAEEIPILELPPEKTPEQIAAEARRELTAYLIRSERADTHYEVLDISQSATIAQIKEAYFRLAKQYHPDKLHQESPEVFKRVQNAFTLLAQAYETLKDVKSRELYDFKLRRDGKATKSEESNESQLQTHSDFFEAGVKMIERELYDQAIAYLGQAVRLSPNTPRYRAFYGTAMGQNPRFKHQAEAELQTAVRLSGNLSEFRVMLAEFYKNSDMPKRAVGELQKILSMEPNNKAARALLESIQK
jgi:curved DNA-binding protein CbpA